jgi:sortase A
VSSRRRWFALIALSCVVSACGSKVDVGRLSHGAGVESASRIVMSDAPVAAPARLTDGAQPVSLSAQRAAPATASGSASVVRPGRNAIAVIEIPKIGLRQPVFEGVSLATLHYGPGHWPGTATFGHFGNAVIAGHRITNTRPFFDIDLLSPGDQIILTTESDRFVYEMTEHLIVGPRDTWIAQDTEGAILTLFACHPKGSKSHRYVVRARLTSTPLPRTATQVTDQEQALPGDSTTSANEPATQTSPEPAPSESPPPQDSPSPQCNSLLCRFQRRAA